jgi:hypothetical protein
MQGYIAFLTILTQPSVMLLLNHDCCLRKLANGFTPQS